MIKIAAIAAILLLPACASAPADPEARAAWEAEKTARTEARRPAPGSVLPGTTREPAPDAQEDFEALRQEMDSQTDPLAPGH